MVAGRTDGRVQGAETRRDRDMTGHIQHPNGRGNPNPAPSPAPGPGPGPGASERVALKKEIGLVSACTIIIGEQGPGQTGRRADGQMGLGWQGQRLRARGAPCLRHDGGAVGVRART